MEENFKPVEITSILAIDNVLHVVREDDDVSVISSLSSGSFYMEEQKNLNKFGQTNEHQKDEKVLSHPLNMERVMKTFHGIQISRMSKRDIYGSPERPTQSHSHRSNSVASVHPLKQSLAPATPPKLHAHHKRINDQDWLRLEKGTSSHGVSRTNSFAGSAYTGVNARPNLRSENSTITFNTHVSSKAQETTASSFRLIGARPSHKRHNSGTSGSFGGSSGLVSTSIGSTFSSCQSSPSMSLTQARNTAKANSILGELTGPNEGAPNNGSPNKAHSRRRRAGQVKKELKHIMGRVAAPIRSINRQRTGGNSGSMTSPRRVELHRSTGCLA
mmetsp:Transcript_26683/g.40925  ORF Transcript_26683/g.40925 Transcript_26683/m.40925 type:complete len:330 (-) Transcript_26683:787-1776(-)|eukprot:CAMPEP_0118698122 /NCGR_PEP_ID=MMETSP0800-20121206/14997_1 /TAXON_ID=210618 ORGANISM="Striatella unipunctata, Strain CCMP2910" /NCGR_SAMPLE_ID=MMETSP0800 /ASSEMBLY_ACC=CAM_ASM_000638 /LENGTH=329 /DNA_ID=CAMNT_0006597851 /DNA_START=130 /DNA_END=1119 /DNA_ORIENTATION=-